MKTLAERKSELEDKLENAKSIYYSKTFKHLSDDEKKAVEAEILQTKIDIYTITAQMTEKVEKRNIIYELIESVRNTQKIFSFAY